MEAGSQNLFAATYKVFGDIVVSQYPELVPNYAPVEQILDTSYVKSLAGLTTAAKTQADKPAFDATPLKAVVSRKSWQINFESGKATFPADAAKSPEEIQR